MSQHFSAEEIKLLDDTLKELEYKQVLEKISKKCYSTPGKELILKHRPIEDVFWLRKEHDLVDEMTHLYVEDDPLPFGGLTDVRMKIQKSLVENAVLNTTDLLAVADVIRVFRLVKSYFSARAEKYPKLHDEVSPVFENKILEKHITDAIDENGTVRDSASMELSRIRRSIYKKSQYLRARLQKILKQVSEEDMVMEEFVTMREGRFVLPVKAEHKRHIPGIIHGVSQTGSTVFLEPSEIFEMNNEVSLLLNEEKREIYKILLNLTKELSQDARSFLDSMVIISHLDVLHAKASYALEFGGIKPEIWNNNEIFLRELRHPLLVHSKSKEKVRPLNITFDNSKRGHLISGPNAGGKTVALKSIGLNIAMALSGIFPLGVCKTNFRYIFSAIGDHQSIENDLSTFSSQIMQLQRILDYCTNQSLVLIDEIGSGTDPQEGSALAAGILDTFVEMKLFFIATTHQSSLKSYALSREEIENASLEFDEKELKPTYNFLSGIPGNSYAFILAKSIGLSERVLDRAVNYMGTKQHELEKSISMLQKFRNETEQLRNELFKQKMAAEKAKTKFDTKYQELLQKREEYIQKAKKESFEIIKNANSAIEKAIKEVQEQKKDFASIKKEYQETKQKLEKEVTKFDNKELLPVKKQKLAVGDEVTLTDSPSSQGTIIEIFDDGTQATVDFNGVKFKLPMNQLVKTEKQETKTHQYSEYIKFDAKTKIDLRGMRAEAALSEVEVFISDAVMGNIDLLTIVHGKGTGALRQAIHEYLDSHHQVNSYRLGTLTEGGAGVTVVILSR